VTGFHCIDTVVLHTVYMINITLMLLFAKQAEINDDKKCMFSHNISVFCDFLPLMTRHIYCVAVEDRYSVLY
jgi:hypothetical protein